MPLRAQNATRDGYGQGIVVAIEATEVPDIVCILNGDSLAMVPIGGETPRAPVVHAQYVCPPGGVIPRVAIDGTRGAGGGCGKPEPPDDAFVRVTRLASVAVWTREGFGSVLLTREGAQLTARVHVRGPGQPTLHAELAASADGTAVSAPRVRSMGPGTFEIEADASNDVVATVEVHAHAIAYGPCADSAPCVAPSGDVTIEVGP